MAPSGLECFAFNSLNIIPNLFCFIVLREKLRKKVGVVSARDTDRYRFRTDWSLPKLEISRMREMICKYVWLPCFKIERWSTRFLLVRAGYLPKRSRSLFTNLPNVPMAIDTDP